jgi:hypothetical protein
VAFHSLLGSGEKFTAGLKEPTRTVSRYLIDNMYSRSVLQQYVIITTSLVASPYIYTHDDTFQCK